MNRKKMKCICMTILALVLFLFYYHFTLEGNHDFRAHSSFALELHKLSNMSLKEFLNSVKFPHIISYPGWHLCFSLIYMMIKMLFGILHISIQTDTLRVVAVALLNTGCILATYSVTEKIFNKYFKNIAGTKWVPLITVITVFMGSIYLPAVFENYYQGPKTGNIWHNPTYLIVKPAAVAVFFLYVQIFQNHSKCDCLKNMEKKYLRTENIHLLTAAVLLSVSAFLKPSLYQMFVPALFVYCVIELLAKRGKTLRFLVKIGISVVPVTLVALFQMQLSIGETGIGIEWMKVWRNLTDHWVIALIVSVAFPLTVAVFHRRQLIQNKMLALGLVTFCSAMSQYMLLYVKKKFTAGDFGWGFSLAVFLLYLVGIILLENTWNDDAMKRKRYIAAIILGLHLICGVLYFADIYKYLDYMIPLRLS